LKKKPYILPQEYTEIFQTSKQKSPKSGVMEMKINEFLSSKALEQQNKH
jgi:hypothetical protein